MSVRKLTRIVTIDDIKPAVNADALEIAVIGGWHVVVQKDIFTKGDKAIYAEIDACIPVDDIRFDFNENIIKNASTVNGKKVLKVKTIKLRGNLSQGILFPLDNFPELHDTPVGEDISKQLGIFKFEEELPVGVIGRFDSKIAHVSDSERVQNLQDFWDILLDHEWVSTEKLDGTSTTIAHDGDTIRVFGRNTEVNVNGHRIFNVFSQEEFLENVPEGYALQGELIGPKIQSNKLKLDETNFRVFSVFYKGREVPRSEWSDWVNTMAVPVFSIDPRDYTVDELVEFVDGMKSTVNPNVLAEGVVFHEKNGEIIPELGRSTFKVISNKFLLKG